MQLRSAAWFEGRDEIGPQSRSVLRTLGWTPEFFAGKPVIGIANGFSELNNCSLTYPALVAAAKRGVIAAGGVPLEFTTLSLGEELMKPSAMLYRNLLAMEIEEVLRSYPLDGVVLISGCDKTTPAQLMAAASANLPAIQICAGPKLTGRWRGTEIGSGTDLWRYLDAFRAGTISAADWEAVEACYSCGAGTCNTMGTASTMAVIAEAIGMQLPGTAAIPASDARRLAAAEASGRRAVGLVREQLLPSQIMTRSAFANALHAFLAVGGSTNAVIHLLAIAGRLRVPLALADVEAAARITPVLADIQPAGRQLMAAFDDAGGVPALLGALGGLIDRTCLTVAGQPLGTTIAPPVPASAIRPFDSPLYGAEGLAVLTGNLAPRGALIRASTASPALLRHTGAAIVFDSYQEMLERIDDPELPVTADSVLVLRNAGAVGVPGLPEWGSIPVPKKLLTQGITDLVRLSDSRMSGTSSGTVVLHITPEAAIGGPLALVRDGDRIAIDLAQRQLTLLVSDDELSRRREAWHAPVSEHRRGYPRLYREHVLQPDEGCDFDFLRPQRDEDLIFIQPIVGRS